MAVEGGGGGLVHIYIMPLCVYIHPHQLSPLKSVGLHLEDVGNCRYIATLLLNGPHVLDPILLLGV